MTADEIIDHYLPKFIDPIRLFRQYPRESPLVLTEALDAQVASGLLRKAVYIAEPGGVLIAGPYDNFEEVPKDCKFPNRFHDFYYDLEDCTVVHGYLRVNYER